MLFRAGLRELRRRWIQTALAFTGIAVGAAVVVAIDTASHSVKRGFEISSETVNGRATHRISGGPGGLDEQVYVTLRRAGIGAVPFVSGSVSIEHNTSGVSYQLLGIDPSVDGAVRGFLDTGDVSDTRLEPVDPFAVYMTSDAARGAGLGKGTTFGVVAGTRRTPVQLEQVLQPREAVHRQGLTNAIVADIALAQHVLGMAGRLSHVDLVVAADDDTTVAAATALLPPGARITTTGTRTRDQVGMLKALETNLLALSLLALLIGVFLIYNTMTFSVVRRRQNIGMLRAVGVTRAEIAAQVLTEAALLGAIASAVGVLLGLGLSRGLVGLLTQTVSDLYFRTEVTSVSISGWALVKGWGLGVMATVAAAALPAWEATRTVPRAVMSRADLETRSGLWSRHAMLAGAVMVVLSVVLLALPGGSLLAAFTGLFLLIVGFALVIPALLPALVSRLVPVMGRLGGLEAVMGARSVVRSTSRTGVAVAALAVAVSATMGVGIMISSFRISVIDWLDIRLRSDVYLTTDAPRGLPDVFTRQLNALPGVRHVGLGRRASIDTADGPVNLFALQTTVDGFAGYITDPGQRAALWPHFQNANLVLVSEPYASRTGTARGDVVTLPTDVGDADFAIGAVYTDYGSDRGVVLMSRATYRRHFDDPVIGAASLKLEDGVDVDIVKQAVRDAPSDGLALDLMSNRDLKDASLVVFDRTFAVTDILRLLAIVVAAIGIISALMALQFDRARDFAVLRAVGMTPTQIARLSTVETAILGVASGLAAVPLGILTAWILVRVINERSFGWSMGFYLDPAMVLQGIGLAVIAALVAGVVPTWRVIRLAPAAHLRND